MLSIYEKKKKKIAEDILKYFSYFPQKTGFDHSCKLSPEETVCMHCQTYFLGKKKKTIINMLSAEFVPRVVIEKAVITTAVDIILKYCCCFFVVFFFFFFFVCFLGVFFCFFFRDNKAWYFMQIICLADDSHEISSLIFCVK